MLSSNQIPRTSTVITSSPRGELFGMRICCDAAAEPLVPSLLMSSHPTSKQAKRETQRANVCENATVWIEMMSWHLVL